MNIVKRRLNYNNEGQQQVLHLETSSDMVLRDDSTDVEASLVSAEEHLTTLQTLSDQAFAALAILNGTGAGSVAKAVSDGVLPLNEAIAVINGTGAGSIIKAVADGLASIVADAPESLNDLKEISDWILSHTSDAATMNSAIQQNAAAIAALQSGGMSKKVITFTAANFVSNVYTIPAATHGLPNGDFMYKLYVLDGSVYKADTWATTEAQVAYTAAGAITITQTGGFAGKIVLIG